MGTTLLAAFAIMLPSSWAEERAAMEAAAQATAELAELHSSYIAKPEDAGIAAELGTAFMQAPEVPPNQKYKYALRLYRRALRSDPDHPQALANKELIEEIYVSMGRPIPR